MNNGNVITTKSFLSYSELETLRDETGSRNRAKSCNTNVKGATLDLTYLGHVTYSIAQGYSKYKDTKHEVFFYKSQMPFKTAPGEPGPIT